MSQTKAEELYEIVRTTSQSSNPSDQPRQALAALRRRPFTPVIALAMAEGHAEIGMDSDELIIASVDDPGNRYLNRLLSRVSTKRQWTLNQPRAIETLTRILNDRIQLENKTARSRIVPPGPPPVRFYTQRGSFSGREENGVVRMTIIDNRLRKYILSAPLGEYEIVRTAGIWSFPASELEKARAWAATLPV